MKAIILSAGQGRRLLPLTESRPKCGVDVNGLSVLEWQLREISQCAVDEVVVATGYAASVVDEIVERFHAPKLRVRTAFNPFYAHCDNLGTCWVMRHEMQGDFIVINGDTLFEAAVLQKLLAERAGAPIMLVADRKTSYDDDDMQIVARGKRLQRVGKRLGLPEVNGESIGMLAFDATGGAAFRNILDVMMRQQEGLGRWYLSAIDALAREGMVRVCSIHGLSWCEIDTRHDLTRAEDVVAGWAKEPPPAAGRKRAASAAPRRRRASTRA